MEQIEIIKSQMIEAISIDAIAIYKNELQKYPNDTLNAWQQAHEIVVSRLKEFRAYHNPGGITANYCIYYPDLYDYLNKTPEIFIDDIELTDDIVSKINKN